MKDDKMFLNFHVDDEPPAVLNPSALYLEHHVKKSVVLPEYPATDMIKKYNLNKIRPTYKGVSVLPSRSKAGLFFRRMLHVRMVPEDDASRSHSDGSAEHVSNSYYDPSNDP
jgi:hypothetical protein